MPDHDIVVPAAEEQDTIRVPHFEEFALGSWVWVAGDPDEDAEEDENGEVDVDCWFGCITHIGSNFVRVSKPTEHGTSSIRVHFDKLIDTLTIEEDPDSVIREECEAAQLDVRTLLRKARLLLEGLGIKDKRLLQSAPEETSALAVASGTADPQEHKRALIKAQDEDLPEIFKKVKEANENLAMWAGARCLEMTAAVGAVKSKVGEIKGRVRTVQLYAGLAEDIELVREGDPAPADEKLRIMQRRCYMDEESLLDYKTGGLVFKGIGGFDRWLSKEKNLNRILPFPKCMVAFQVRRHVKEREWDGTFAGVFVKMELDQSDKFTYLYIRNGDRLSRLTTEIEFDARLFPGKTELVIGQKMWSDTSRKIEDLITDDEFQALVKERQEERKKAKAWKRKHPKKDSWRNPHRDYRRDLLDTYEAYDSRSVHFDDMDKVMKDRIDDYNLIAYIVQGLFDRSEVLHPHSQARLWTPGGFDAAIELIYDDDNVLAPSEAPPSWEDYRTACNESLGVGSVTIGQEFVWEKKEARKENARKDRDWRDTSTWRHTTYSPMGNPGPGRIATIAKWMPRAGKAVYRWERERSWASKQRSTPWRPLSEYIDCDIKVAGGDLFNISAYKPGDYLQFFRDPRTRLDYLKWANYLLSAEEYHAGNPDFQPGAAD